MTKASRAEKASLKTPLNVLPSDTMQVGFGVARKIEIDNDVDGLNVDTTSEQIRADQIATVALTEIVENAIAMLLSHLRVNVVARVANLGDLLSQQLHALSRIAENDGLIDLKLAEQSVQAVNLLLLVNKSVELSNAQQSQLLHQIDLVWITHMLGHETSDSAWKSSRVEHDLTLRRQMGNQTIQHRHEVLGQQLVGFIQNEHVAVLHLGNAFVHQIENASRSSNDQVNNTIQTEQVITQIRSA
jgi:hypothetical protein